LNGEACSESTKPDNCLTGSIIRKDECTECIVGYYLSQTKCVKNTVNNCKTFSKTADDC